MNSAMSHPYKTNLYFSTDLILQICFLLLENIIKRGTVFLNLKDELHLTSMKQDTGAFFFFFRFNSIYISGCYKNNSFELLLGQVKCRIMDLACSYTPTKSLLSSACLIPFYNICCYKSGSFGLLPT